MVIAVTNCGETFHHNNPSPLTDNLYLSAARAISSRVLLDLGITCVINATLELPTMAYQLTDTIQIAVEDRIGSKLYVYFDLVADKINSVHLAGAEQKCMIYCRAGMSRSASLCIAYFMKYRGMSLDEAYEYVKARRPIIHPNVGFLRQLREYERKLRGRSPIGRSVVFRPKRSGAAAAGQRSSMVELPALKFASDELAACGTGIVEWDGGVKVIKPIARPRRPSVRYSEFFDHYMELNPPHVVDLYDDRLANAPGHRGERLTHVDAGARPEEALAVAQVRGATPIMEATISTTPEGATRTQPVAPPRRKPFRKISEPAKIAVSFLNQALVDLSHLALNHSPMYPNRGINTSFSCSTVAAEQLPQVSEAVALECLVDIPDTKAVTTRTGANSTARMSGGRARRRGVEKRASSSSTKSSHSIISRPDSLQCAISLLSRLHLSVAEQAARPTTWEGENLLEKPTNILERTKSMLQPPGTKVLPQPVADERHLLAAAASLTQLVLEDPGEGGLTPVRWRIKYPHITLTGPFTSLAVSEEVSPCEFGSVNMKMRLRMAWLLAVPLRTAVSEDAASEVTMPFVMEAAEVMETLLMPSKEFPYYSICKKQDERSSEFEFARAREEPVIESCWFFALAPRKSTKTVCMVPQVEVRKNLASEVTVTSERKRRSAIPTISWAAERYQVQQNEEKAKPIPSVDRGSARRIFTGEKLRSAQSVLDQSLFSLHKTKPLRRFTSCLYDPWFISAVAVHAIDVAEHFEAAVFELHNLYCEPTRIGDVGKASVVEGKLCVAESVVPDVRNAEELVEIPDAFGDMTALKRKIMEQSDPVKISIWLEVFKRGVIVSRPIFPLVSLAELLTVAVEEEINRIEECSTWEGVGEHFVSEAVLNLGGWPEATNGRGRMTLHQHHLTAEVVPEELTDDCFCDCFDEADASLDIVGCSFVVCVVACNETLQSPFHFENKGDRLFQTWNTRRVLHPFGAGIASKLVQDPMGTCIKRQQDIPREFLKRKPFQKVSALRVSPPQQTISTILQAHLPVPDYEFVQDIEDQADLCHHFEPVNQSVTSVTGPVDTLWFFELEKPAEVEIEGAAGAASRAARPVTPFQLYLPDSYLIDKVGQEGMDVFKPEEEAEVKAENQRPLELIPTELRRANPQYQQQHLVAGSVRPRNNRAEKRISFIESMENPRNSRNSRDLTKMETYGLVSYQKPTSRTRSVSRSRRSEVLSSTSSSSMASEDARAMAHLKASMKQAEEVLDRRAMRSTSATRAGPVAGSAAATVEERLEERRSRLSKARDSRLLSRESHAESGGGGGKQGTRYLIADLVDFAF